MKNLALVCMLLLPAMPALAQPDIVYASAADIQALIAKARVEPPRPLVIEPVVTLPPYRVNLEYRAMTAPAATHESEAELMLVLDGAATMVIGGASQAVAKGDFMFVPQNMPHQIKDPKGALVLMTLLVPRPVPGLAPAANPAPERSFISAADVQAALATARAVPPRPIVAEPLVNLAPYRVALEYNPIKGNAAIHDSQAELMVVLDGAGEFVMGGSLIDEKRNNPANRSGSAVAGGTTYHLAQGDVIFVPEGIAHQVTQMAPGGLTLMTIHPPRPIPKE